MEIVEIIGPSKQGFTIPYLCRGEDGELYYVKGRHSHCSSQWREWICGHAGQAFGLNVPPFRIVHIDQALLDEAPPAWRELGEGYWFGSQEHPVASWFEPSMTQQVSLTERRDVLVFDWWVCNMDRTRGNTNLLWDFSAGKLVVIDHNQAFDCDFTPATFLDHHIFADVFESVKTDLVQQAEYVSRLSDALQVARLACDNAPPEWRWVNAEQDVACPFCVTDALGRLERCTTDELWRTV